MIQPVALRVISYSFIFARSFQFAEVKDLNCSVKWVTADGDEGRQQ